MAEVTISPQNDKRVLIVQVKIFDNSVINGTSLAQFWWLGEKDRKFLLKSKEAWTFFDEMKIEMEWQPNCRVQLVFPPRISFFRGESPVIHQNFYAISDRGNRLFSEAHFKIFHSEMGPFETGQFTRVIDRFEALKTDFSPHPNTRM